MLEEHKAIAAALEDLHREAEAENKPEVARLAEEIRQHAQTLGYAETKCVRVFGHSTGQSRNEQSGSAIPLFAP